MIDRSKYLDEIENSKFEIFKTPQTRYSPSIEESITKQYLKYNYYLDIAEVVGTKGTCIRRNYGAIIVKNDEIISTGYTGAPRGRINCNKINECKREKEKIPSGQRYEMCRSVHAEMNAIISAKRDQMIGSVLFLVGREYVTSEYNSSAFPCSMCIRNIINAGIEKVIIRNTKTIFSIYDVKKFIEYDDSL